jgi:hypothetical protein
MQFALLLPPDGLLCHQPIPVLEFSSFRCLLQRPPAVTSSRRANMILIIFTRKVCTINEVPGRKHPHRCRTRRYALSHGLLPAGSCSNRQPSWILLSCHLLSSKSCQTGHTSSASHCCRRSRYCRCASLQEQWASGPV